MILRTGWRVDERQGNGGLPGTWSRRPSLSDNQLNYALRKKGAFLVFEQLPRDRRFRGDQFSGGGWSARDVRFTVAWGARWSDPGPTTAGNPENVGYNHFRELLIEALGGP
jgi:hypothetical protein